jgi:hypothetical protein
MMGKKKRNGVVWSQDENSGSPIGEDVKVWDGISRTTKRTQKKAIILDQQDLLIRGSQLKEEVLELVLAQVKEGWSELDDYHRELEEESLVEVLTYLESLKTMKRSGAKQRLIKHISASLDDIEWSILEKIMAYSDLH